MLVPVPPKHITTTMADEMEEVEGCVCVNKRSKKKKTSIVCPTDDVCGVYCDGLVVSIFFYGLYIHDDGHPGLGQNAILLFDFVKFSC